jgi:uncharacterized tellurite resistance protein B-like protein
MAMDLDHLSPLDILAVGLAFAALADKEVVVEERASMVAILSKLVRLEDLTERQLQNLSSDAFRFAQQTKLENFTSHIRGRLRPAQAMSVLANMTDMVLADGRVCDGEVRVIDKVREALGVDVMDYRAIREVIMLKNDTGLFTNPNHSWNEKTYRLRVAMRSTEE